MRQVGLGLRAFGSAVALILLVLLGAPSARAMDTQTLEIVTKSGVHVFTVEVATTEQEKTTGLMYRKELADGRGMLFDFQRDQEVSMWMKNTFIPLSVAFIDNKGIISNIEDMKPHDETPHGAVKPVRYALEMNAGWFAKRGIKGGVKIEGLEKTPAPK